MPFQALGGTAPHEAIASRGQTSGPYSPSLRTSVQLEPNEGSYVPDNLGSRVRDMNTTTYLHFPAPSQGGNPLHAIQRHPEGHRTAQNTPMTIDNPAHTLHIPPYTPRAPSTAPTQQGSNTLNPLAPSFVPTRSEAARHHNGNHHAPPPTATSPAPSTTLITDLVRLTCPDDLTPDRWAQFLDFCLAHGIGQQTPSHQSAFATNEHALSHTNTNPAVTRSQTIGGALKWSDEDEDLWRRQGRRHRR